MEHSQTQQAWLLFAISLMALMINFDYTAVNLSLVTIAHHLHTSLNTIQWTLSGYMLAWAALTIPAGKQIDRFGQKRMCLIGIALFLFSSVLAGLSENGWMLISARVLQGISGAIYVPTLYALIFKHFHKQRLGFAMGLLSVGVGFGMAIGPTVGGIILHYFGWRWIFLMNIPIALIGLFIIARCADPDQMQSSLQKPDNIGAILLGLSLILFIFALSKMQIWGLGSVHFIAAIIASLLLFLGLTVWQSKSRREPIIPFHLFLNKSYTAVVLAFFLEQYAFSASMVLISLFLQKVLNLSILKASLMFLALNLLFGIVSPFGGTIIDKVGVKWPAFLGLLILALGLAGFSQLTPNTSQSLIYLCLMITGFGMGISFTSLNSGMVKTIKASESGIASSVFLLFALLGNICGVVISTLIYETSADNSLIQALSKNTLLSQAQLAQLKNTIHYIGEQTHNLSTFSITMQHKIMLLMPYSLNMGISKALILTTIGVFIASALVICFIHREASS